MSTPAYQSQFMQHLYDPILFDGRLANAEALEQHLATLGEEAIGKFALAAQMSDVASQSNATIGHLFSAIEQAFARIDALEKGANAYPQVWIPEYQRLLQEAYGKVDQAFLEFEASFLTSPEGRELAARIDAVAKGNLIAYLEKSGPAILPVPPSAPGSSAPPIESPPRGRAPGGGTGAAEEALETAAKSGGKGKWLWIGSGIAAATVALGAALYMGQQKSHAEEQLARRQANAGVARATP